MASKAKSPTSEVPHSEQLLFKKNEYVFAPDPQELWIACQVYDINSKVVTVMYPDKTIKHFKPKELYNNAITNNNTFDDLTRSSILNEPSILENLKLRYANSNIYTFAGSILISINPYRTIKNLYTTETIKNYFKQTESSPHLYSVAKAAYNELLQSYSQSILVSGESGAGKTESTKHILRFFAINCNETKGQTNIEQKVVQSNPLLEAFGNSKTLRNENSSRFGKLIELQFENQQIRATLMGGKINSYLLESVRVTSVNNGERNFHIFYQIFRAVEMACKENTGYYNFPSFINIEPKYHNIFDFTQFYYYDDLQFNYLGDSISYTLENVDDLVQFEETIYSMMIIGFKVEEIQLVLEIVYGLLCLGNIEFLSNENLSDTKIHTQVDENAYHWVQKFSQFLGFETEATAFALTKREMNVDEIVTIHFTKAQAIQTRDTLARTIYHYLFDYLIKKINENLVYNNNTSLSCGILDIFGFESFEKNSLEQLLINYTNEIIQKLFNDTMYIEEKKNYLDEGIQWFDYNYPDNQSTLEKLNGSNGIFDKLDEQTLVMNGSDQTFHNNLSKLTLTGKTRLLPAHTFLVQHYAGEVDYYSIGFVEKNKHQLNEALSKFIKKSKIRLISTLLNNTSLSTKHTTSSILRKQLTVLQQKLINTRRKFIRCIRPNKFSVPYNFDTKFINEQLIYAGVLQAIQVSRSGYPVRMKFDEFYNNFYKLMAFDKHKDMQNNNTHIKDKVTELTYEINKYVNFPNTPDFPSYQAGKTMIFLKQNTFNYIVSTSNTQRINFYKLGLSALTTISVRHIERLLGLLKKFVRPTMLRAIFSEYSYRTQMIVDRRNKRNNEIYLLSQKYQQIRNSLSIKIMLKIWIELYQEIMREKLNLKINYLEDQLKIEMEKTKNLNIQISSKTEEINNLSNKLHTVKTELNTAHREIENLTHTLKDKECQLSNYKQIIDIQSNDIGIESEKYKKLFEENNFLHTTITSHEKTIESLTHDKNQILKRYQNFTHTHKKPEHTRIRPFNDHFTNNIDASKPFILKPTLFVNDYNEYPSNIIGTLFIEEYEKPTAMAIKSFKVNKKKFFLLAIGNKHGRLITYRIADDETIYEKIHDEKYQITDQSISNEITSILFVGDKEEILFSSLNGYISHINLSKLNDNAVLARFIERSPVTHLHHLNNGNTPIVLYVTKGVQIGIFSIQNIRKLARLTLCTNGPISTFCLEEFSNFFIIGDIDGRLICYSLALDNKHNSFSPKPIELNCQPIYEGIKGRLTCLSIFSNNESNHDKDTQLSYTLVCCISPNTIIQINFTIKEYKLTFDLESMTKEYIAGKFSEPFQEVRSKVGGDFIIFSTNSNDLEIFEFIRGKLKPTTPLSLSNAGEIYKSAIDPSNTAIAMSSDKGVCIMRANGGKHI